MNLGNPTSEPAHLDSTYTSGSQKMVSRPGTAAWSVNFDRKAKFWPESWPQNQKLWDWDRAVPLNKPSGWFWGKAECENHCSTQACSMTRSRCDGGNQEVENVMVGASSKVIYSRWTKGSLSWETRALTRKPAKVGPIWRLATFRDIIFFSHSTSMNKEKIHHFP